jgi:hypothetical protein
MIEKPMTLQLSNDFENYNKLNGTYQKKRKTLDD